MTAAMKAPFPWFGGKSLAAGLIWARLGNVVNYVEPFAGSLAVLLARPHPPKIETVNDKDGFVANFWRSLQADPEATAHYADNPVNENDLHARHVWLVARREELTGRLEGDPDLGWSRGCIFDCCRELLRRGVLVQLPWARLVASHFLSLGGRGGYGEAGLGVDSEQGSSPPGSGAAWRLTDSGSGL